MRILDLYCGAGGAAMGYHMAGFEIVGVDIARQPRYPFELLNFDALQVMRVLLSGSAVHGYALADFDAIHASPPCQRYSAMSNCRPGLADEYPDLVGPTRFMLKRAKLPYVIENVVGAPLRHPVMLCGTHFERRVTWPGGGIYELQRHRLFECSFPVPSPGTCNHRWPSFPVYGHSAPGNRPELHGAGFMEKAREVMGISWTNREELGEAVPPAYTHYVGEHLAAYLTEHQEAA